MNVEMFEAETFAKQVATKCETDQVCVRLRNKSGPIVSSDEYQASNSRDFGASN